MDKAILLGCGGHAASILDSVLSSKKYEVVGIVDPNMDIGKTLLGVSCIGDDSCLEKVFNNGIHHAFIGVGSIGNITIRVQLYHLTKGIGYTLPAIIDASAIIGRDCHIGEGVFIGKGSIINTQSVIEEMAIINSATLLEHQCYVGKFTHIAPGCRVGGNSVFGRGSHIGIGSTVIQGVKIGDNTLVGAGSVVVKDIKSGVKAFGNPCREVGMF